MLNNVLMLLLFAPLIIIMWLANMADRQRLRGRPSTGLAALSYIFLVGYYMIMLAGGLVFLLLNAIASGPAPSEAKTMMQGFASPGLLGLGLVLPSAIGMLLPLRPARRLFAHVISIDPASTAHAVALAYTMLVPINSLTLLGMGLDNLAAGMGQAASNSDGQILLGLWTQELLWVALGMVGVGLLSRYGWRAVLHRLGLVAPRLHHVGLGLAAGIAMAALAQLVFALASGAGFPIDEGVRRLNEQIYGPWSRTAVGVLTIGVSAALGEETLFRGALQPRFGLILTSAIFALLHSNYGLSLATLVVLAVGVGLGLMRQRYSTSASMLTHATYNIAQSLLDLGLP
ncbi:MAG: CPBP family intramembrane metalloprotease [Chloroflexi bacterium]|nr:CPBP family intramembrane metalloprotease [Chloroflexota bacterium]